MAKEQQGELAQRREQQQGWRPQGQEGGGLARWDPFGSLSAGRGPFGFMRRMMDEMDRMFQDLGFGESWEPRGGSSWSEQFWTPRVDVRQRNDAFVVRADLPGVRQEDVEVEIDSGALRIQGQRREEHEAREGETHRRECVYGHFVRTIPLPEGADVDKAKASFANGVLEVTIPAPERRGRRIAISSPPEGAAGTTTH